MKVTINKSEVKGKLKIPSSKSQTLRGLMCAALAKGESELLNPLVCEDSAAALDVLEKVGIHVQQEKDLWRVQGGTLRAPETELNCGESATTLRFMTAICALIPGKHRLVGGPSLMKRPMRSLTEALQKLGVQCSLEFKTAPPVTCEGGTLKGGETELPGNISSQFISALLLVAPFAQKDVSIRLSTELTSRSYVLMTLRALRKFGISVTNDFDKFVVSRQTYKTARFNVEGDWSSASYYLALGTASPGIEVENLSTSSLQGDRVILDYIRAMGARVKVSTKAITVSQGKLKAIHANLSDCIDLLPTMAVLAALADGKSEFTGIERARIKESNRVAAMKEGLEKLGIVVTEDRDRLTIVGMLTPKVADTEEYGDKVKEAKPVESAPGNVLIDSRDDHRIAMAFGIMGAAIGGITVDGAECVAKTYPQFWDSLKGLGGQLEIDAK
jgi:3-phosphoshikimate 1-carboxyvinyltransferase